MTRWTNFLGLHSKAMLQKEQKKKGKTKQTVETVEEERKGEGRSVKLGSTHVQWQLKEWMWVWPNYIVHMYEIFKDIQNKLKNIIKGMKNGSVVERALWMLFERTWFPGPTWWLITFCILKSQGIKCSLMASSSPRHTSGAQTYSWTNLSCT